MPVWLRLTVFARPQPMALQVGSRLGHLDMTALLGEGGMGQVYRANDAKIDRYVAGTGSQL
jgi:hypothetical protein